MYKPICPIFIYNWADGDALVVNVRKIGKYVLFTCV